VYWIDRPGPTYGGLAIGLVVWLALVFIDRRFMAPHA
jgi:hypothetical protein